MSINFPKSPSTDDTYTYLTTTWRWNGVAWEKSAATETGNTEGTTGGIAYYEGKSSTIKGALNAFYDETNERVGIGTSGPTELLDVRGGITASGIIYAAGGITSGDSISAGNTIIKTSGGWNSSSGLNVSHAGAEIAKFRNTGISLNSEGADIDTGIKGSSDDNLLKANAGNDRIGIGTGSPTEKLDVRGGITASGNIFTAQELTANTMKVDGDATIGGVTFSGGGATFSTVVGLTSGGELRFADGSTQSSCSLSHYSLNAGGNPFYAGQVISGESVHHKGLDLSTSDATDIAIALQSTDVPDVPGRAAKYIFSLGSNVPKKDETNTFTHSSGNIFNTPIGTTRLSPGNAVQVLLAALDHSTSTYIGLTGGLINHKILGNDVMSSTTGLVEFYQGISADMGVTFGGTINCQDQEVTRPKLKDYSETVNAIGTVNSNTEVNFENGNVQTVTVGGNCEFSFGGTPSSGQAGTVTLIITNGGGHTTTWHSSVKWPSDVAPSLTTSGSNPDIITFLTTDGGSNIYGFVGGLNFS